MRKKELDYWFGYHNVKTGARSGCALTPAEAKRAKKKGIRSGSLIEKEGKPYDIYFFKSLDALRRWQKKGKRA